jgi:hypothetical protein
MGVMLLAVLVLGLGAGLLAIPLDLSLSYRSATDARLRTEVVWLFGALRYELRPGPKREGTPRRWPSLRRLHDLWDEGLGERVGELFRVLRRVVDLHEFFAHARLGTGDPAEMGMLMGVIQPLRAALLAAFPSASFEVEPDFVQTTLQVDAHGVATIVPLTTLPPALRFLLSPVTLRTLRALRDAGP